jgi:hypothetical protein
MHIASAPALHPAGSRRASFPLNARPSKPGCYDIVERTHASVPRSRIVSRDGMGQQNTMPTCSQRPLRYNPFNPPAPPYTPDPHPHPHPTSTWMAVCKRHINFEISTLIHMIRKPRNPTIPPLQPFVRPLTVRCSGLPSEPQTPRKCKICFAQQTPPFKYPASPRSTLPHTLRRRQSAVSWALVGCFPLPLTIALTHAA